MSPQEKPKKSLTYVQKVRAGLVKPKPRQAMKQTRGPISTKPRKRLRQVSKANVGRMEAYRKWINIALAGVEACQRCGTRGEGLEPHHPSGRGGQHLFEVIGLCSCCHRWVHENANKAYAEGWLQPPIKGRSPDPAHPVPFEAIRHFDKRYDAFVAEKTILETDDLEQAKAAIAAALDKSSVETIDGMVEIWSIWDNLKNKAVLMSGDLKHYHHHQQ